MSDIATPDVRDALQRPIRDLRISVMDRCNFRCPYCMPKEKFHEHYPFLTPTERLSFNEIARLARIFSTVGVRKIRLTGGEPLLRPNLPDLVAELSGIPLIEDIALTTNGVLLDKHVTELRASGLNRVTVSLDSIEESVFERLSGGFKGLQRVLDGIIAAREAGLSPIKINAVIQRGINDAGVMDMVEKFRHSNVVLRFIEYMDVGNRNGWRLDNVVPSRELLERIQSRWPLLPIGNQYHGEVAERFTFVDGGGEIGFISSVTQAFCGTCTRARLSSDGQLFTCLFATQGVDLRSPLRSGATDEELTALIRTAWIRRQDRYSEQRRAHTTAAKQKIEMYYIGG